MKSEIEKLLPHKSSMVLIDDILDFNYEEGSVTTSVTISEDDTFFDKELDGVPPYVAMEYMAQAIACYAGLVRKQEGIEPKIGFIIGTRKLENNLEKFENNKIYKITAKKEFFSDNLASFMCLIYDNEDNIVSKAAINVFQLENEKDFLKSL